MTVGIDDNSYAVWDGCPTDASDGRVSVSSSGTDADGSGLARNASVADVDIEIAGSEVNAG